MKTKLMAHLVANYPDEKTAFTVAESLVKGGADILEIQLPFSDPNADGPAIQNACSFTLEKGYKTQDALNFIKKVHEAFPQTTIYIMSYGSLVFTPGVEEFARKAAECGVKGLIIPDLPFDCDEGLTAACKKYGMENIPVAAFGMSDQRLSKMTKCGFEHIYAALRSGITGTETSIEQSTLDFIKKVSAGGAKVYGGFGIQNGEQSKVLSPYVDAVVAGSVFVRIITESTCSNSCEGGKAGTEQLSVLSEKIISKARELTHTEQTVGSAS